MKEYDLQRFINAQDLTHSRPEIELRNGKKESHWIWFVFPQLRGLGYSYYSCYYGLEDLNEAKAYMNNKILRERMINCCNILLDLKEKDANKIMGDIDSMKLKSSITIFYLATKKEIFMKVLNKFFNGVLDEKTLELTRR